MDCTQVLESDELDDSLAYKYKVKVAELKVNNTFYPIFSGSNRIGRDPEFCSVVFNNMTLSKEHAVIEVDDRCSHLIYDLGSKNKTKLGKMTLKPHVRYQLVDKSQILFGDLVAEYFVVPDAEENKPFGIIQESDDEVIPDTPVQSRSRDTKESSSSREESPTIFQMETQCEIGYDEPSVKIVRDPGESEGKLEESTFPQDRSKESSASGASNVTESLAASATGTSEELVSGTTCADAMTTEGNDASDGDETDPEDMFFAMTQKRDECISEPGSKGRSKDDEKDIVENGEVETSGQVMSEHSKGNEAIEKSLDHTNGLNSDKENDLCSSKMEDEEEEDIFSAATQVIVPASKEVQEQSKENLDKYCDENRTDKSEVKRTTGSDSDETNVGSEAAPHSMAKDPQTKYGEKIVFKVPFAADKKIEKIVQIIESDVKETMRDKQETAGPGSETNKEDDEDSIFIAPTQIFQSEKKGTFKVPFDVAIRKEVEQSGEGTKISDNEEVEMKQGTADSDSSKNGSSDSVYDAPTQLFHAESEYLNSCEAVAGIEKKQKGSELDEKKKVTEKECLVNSGSETDDEDCIFNAPTQVVHFRNEHAKSDHVSQVGAAKYKLNKPTAISSFDETNGNVKETKEKRKTVESDFSLNDENNSISDALAQVTNSGKKDANSESTLAEVQKKSEQSGETSRKFDVKAEEREIQHSADSSIEICSEDVSVFEAATQIIHSENKDINSSKALFEARNKTVQKEQDKKEVKEKQETVGSNYGVKDDSICDMETQIIQLESKEANTFKVPTPAKKKSVAFVGVPDDKQSSSNKHAPEKAPKGHLLEADNDDSIFDAPTQIIEYKPTSSSFKGSEDSDSKSSKEAVFSEKNKKQETEHESFSAEPCGTSEVRLSNSPLAHSLDDSDESIFTAPTQIISKPKSVGDSGSPQVDKIEKPASSRDSSKDSLLPDSAFKVVPSTEENTDSVQDITDVVEDSSKNEDSLNDSFFEAPTQLFASSVAFETEDDDDDNADKKAKTPSLSRSSSYGSIHEAPTQCIDDLEASVNDANVKTSVLANTAQVEASAGVEEGENDVAKNAVEVTLPEHNSAAEKERVELILPSSQELRQVGEEYYGCISDDDRPSTSFDTSSPILQKRTRTIPTKRGVYMSESSETVKPTLSSGSKSTDSKSVTPSTSAGDKKLLNSVGSTKRRLRLSMKRSDRKKIAGAAGDVAVDTGEEVDKSKKITDFWGKAKKTREKSANEVAEEENKTSNESETGRPSRVRKPTWKARENSQEMLQTSAQKGKKDETKEHSNISPRLSKQAKSPISSPTGDTSNKQTNSGVVVSSGDQEEVKEVSKISTMKNRKNTKTSTNTRAHSTSSDSNTESKSTTSSPSKERKQVLDVSSSSKKQRSSRLSSYPNSDQNNRKAEDGSKGATDVSVFDAESPAERIKVRNRRKQGSDVSRSSGNQKKDTGSLHESHENEKSGTNKRSRSKLSAAISDSSGSKVESNPGDDITKQNSDISVVSDNPRKTRAPLLFNDQEIKVDGGRGGRPKRSTAGSSASSSDIVTEPVKKGREPNSAHKQRKSSAPFNNKDEIVKVKPRGRPKRSTTASSTSNSDVELKPEAHAKRSNDSDICDTPRKQQKSNTVPSLGVRDKSAGAVKKDRSKRSAKNALDLDVELNPAVDAVHKEQVEESDIYDTPKKQRKISVPLSDGNQEESVNMRRGRPKRSVAASTSPASKRVATSKSKVAPDEVIKDITKPRSTEQRHTVLQSAASDELDSKKEDLKEQKRSRSRKNNSKVFVSEEDQSACNSPSYGASGRRRKALSQVSSTESDGQSSQGDSTPKRSSRLKHQVIYHIMFTGVACSDTDETAIKKLGGKIVQELEACSILITDKIRRTLKFLCILGQGKPIVSPDWIKQSQQSGQFLDPWNFIVKDKEAEKRYSFQLKQSLKEASSKKCLDGYTVFATPSVKPPPTEMKSIVENSGGQFLIKEPPGGKWPKKSFIISAIDDKKLCSKFKKTSVPIVSAEILLTGILQQKLNMSDYILQL